MNAEDLHKEALLIDSHNDTIVAHILKGGYSFFGEGTRGQDNPPGMIEATMRPGDSPARAAPIQINFPKMCKGGIDTAFFAIDVTRPFKSRLTFALDGFGYFLRDIARAGEEVTIVRRSADVSEAKAACRPAAVLAVEHADVVEGSLNVLHALYEFGVRSIGLTHNVSSQAAGGCLEARDGVGLTKFGVALVREMNRVGMLVDLAHVSPGAFYSALEIVDKPVIFSHGNARALCDHPRNLDDDQLKALAANGGVIGMSFVPYFVDAGTPVLERLLDHIEHICEVAGVETVGLGSDFDGGGTLIQDAGRVPDITVGLLERGFAEEDVRKILGQNTFRVLKAAIG